MTLLKRLALPSFAALLCYGFLLTLPRPQINVTWTMPGLPAFANPGAVGNGGNAVQGAGTLLCATDLGGGLCLDAATGTLLELAQTINESVTVGSTASFNVSGSGSPAYAALGSGAIEFSCGISAGAQNCVFGSYNTTAPGMTFSELGGSGMGTTNVNFRWLVGNSSTDGMDLTGATGLQVQLGNIATIQNTAGNGEIVTSGATAESVGKGHVVIGSNGTLIQGTTQACNGSPANPTLFTMVEGLTCLATPGDGGSATSMVISFPYTFTNAPACFITPDVASVGAFDCVTTTTTATVTLAAGGGIPIADKFWIAIVGNGP
jgi:hypothetical protein